MHVDTDSLEQLNLRTRDGAERAGDVFADLLDAETRLGATRIRLLSHRDLAGELHTVSEECVEFGLSGALTGTAILAFEPGTATLIGDASTEAVGERLIEQYVGEWEGHTDDDLTIETSTVVADLSTHEFALGALGNDTESTPVLQSTLRPIEGESGVRLYFAPDAASLDRLIGAGETETPANTEPDDGLFDQGSTTSIPLEKLSVFSDITRVGTRTAARRVTEMTGIETDTEIAGINFTPVEDVSSQLEAGEYVGTTLEFEGTPSGHLVILFRADAARQIAEAMLPVDSGAAELTPMHESALEELGNIMASGFIDGWANVLQTSVEHTPPEYTDEMDMALLEIVTDQLGPFQTHAYTIESRIETDGIAFDCEIHALPDEAELGAALDTLLVERSDQTHVEPGDVF